MTLTPEQQKAKDDEKARKIEDLARARQLEAEERMYGRRSGNAKPGSSPLIRTGRADFEDNSESSQRQGSRWQGRGDQMGRAPDHQALDRDQKPRFTIRRPVYNDRKADSLSVESQQEPAGGHNAASPPRFTMGRRSEVAQDRLEGQSWGQLRRRQETQPQTNDSESAQSAFIQERPQREEQARGRRYVPVGTQSPFTSQKEIESQPRGGRGQDPAREPAQGRYTPIATEASSSASRDYRRRDDTIDRRANQVEQPETRQLTREEEREERERKRAEKFAAEAAARKAEDSYDAPTRGRDRDKAKRRGRFAAEPDEAEMAAEVEARERVEQRKQRKREKAAKKAAAPTPVMLPEYISVSNLATALKIRAEDLVWKMEELGYEGTTYGDILNAEDAGLVAQEYNFEPLIDRGATEDLAARPVAEDSSSLPTRPPVVTIMGHVDHGKTTLLDYLRKSSVAATEHGGITQHIGAFSVPMPGGKIITFLDTPGHAAFLSMRQRGANVTDIVILVVAADDSVKPQTIEAINHAKAAKVPIIVAINKVDKEDANIERVKQDLARHGVDVEDFGGDTQVVCVSGKTGQGMDQLEETATALAEIIDMRAETDGMAEGWVLEASIKSMGKVATVLVRRGTMRPGDFIVAGKTWARIRCLRNEAGVDIPEAGPGTPVEIDGWRDQPLAGDEVLQAPDEQKAKRAVDYRVEKAEREKLAEDMEAINEGRKVEMDKREREKREAAVAEAIRLGQTPDIAAEAEGEEPTGPKEVCFIIKGDVSGSVEAVVDSITALGTKEVQPHILRSGVGQLSEFDVEHAQVAKGHLINFNTPIDASISRAAEAAGVAILDHNVIYRLVDEVREKLSELLPPIITQKVTGEAEVAQVFEITVKGRQQKAIAGVRIKNGIVARNAKVRVMRKGETVFDGMLFSLFFLTSLILCRFEEEG